MCFALLILGSGSLFGQVSGTKSIPTDYATIALFITDINTNGIGAGGVTLNVPAGYTETAPTGGFSITATGTAANPIIIQGTGGAPKPILTASGALTAGALNDGIIKLIGSDYVTIFGLDLRENAANTTTTAASNNMTEWGIALLYATVTDNAQNVTLQDNTITLNRIYQNTFGIYANATHTATTITTSATATGVNGGNSGLKIYGNTISNVNLGVIIVGPTAAADHSNGIDIGGTSLATGNTITNFGTTGTFSGYANVSGTVNGILVRNAINANIQYNTVTSSNAVTSGTIRGIFVQAFSNAPTATFTSAISNNTISIQSAAASGAIIGLHEDATTTSGTSVINIQNNSFSSFGHTVASSGNVTCIQNASGTGTMTISGNTFNSINVNTTGTLYLINNNCSMNSFTVSNNSTTGTTTKTGAGNIVYGYYNFGSPTGGTATISNNNFSNFSITGATSFYGIRQYTSVTQTENIIGNTVSNVTGGTSAIYGISHGYGASGSEVSGNNVNTMSASALVTGIQVGDGTAGNVACYNNQVYGLSSPTANAVVGIGQANGVATSIYRNRIYGLSNSNAGGTVNGILISSGSTTSIHNNVISGLTAPIASGADVIRGININSSSTSAAYGVYYNSIYLSGTSSGANFGTSGIFHQVSATATTAALDLRNNIIINETTPVGTGIAVAFRRSGVPLNNYVSTSNRNLFYAGTPSATHLIMYDGTTSYQTILAYQGAVAPRDVNSFTGEAAFTASGYGTAGNFFISLTGSSSDFLRPVAGITTQVESGGSPISTPSITTDFTGAARPGTPDIGAYEFSGTTPAPIIILNSVTPPTSTLCVATARLVSVNITTASGTITGATIGYSVNGVPQSNITMTNTSGSTWEATIPVPTPTNAVIAWGVAATNSLGLNGSYTGTTYTDEPLTGVTATATASSTTVCASSPTTLTAKLAKSGTASFSSPSGTSSSSGISPFYHGYGGVKTQYIYRASELTSMGFSAGNFTSLAINITSLGTATMNGFTIDMGSTANTAGVANNMIVSGMTPVYANAAQALVSGVNTFTFSTPFVWDGTSNVVISFCYSNVNSGGTSSTVSTEAAVGFVSSSAIFADNTAASCLYSAATTAAACMSTTNSNSTSSVRPNFVLAGNKAPAITSVTWSDGVGTVGTTNPLTVTPTTTTTYTATLTAAGCTVAPSPTVTVTVNSLPGTPTAANSSQCGTQIPTASVTSTSGLPTPTFIWYDAASAGTVLQNGTSNTFTSNVTTTTTFYVSELNTTTGCESARIPVTVSVAAADGILASIDNATICIGGSVVLTAVNTNATPNQTYTYTWTGTAGSGVTSTAGNPITVTPTLAGTYTYTATGVDGSCNAVSTINVTVNPFTVVLSPVNVTCNGYNNGSFTHGTTTCGAAPYTYSVDGGAYTSSIPTNLTPGVHAVIVMNSLGIVSTSQNVTITEPSIVINAPAGVSASVCQGSASALVSASGTTSTPSPVTIVIPFNVVAQPTEVSATSVPTVAASPNVISTAVMAALPAGSVITSATLNYNGIQATGSSWMSDVRLGLSGAATQPYTGGTGSTNAAGTFNYTAPVTPGSVSISGGSISLHYFDFYNDNTAGSESTFPTGAGVANLTIVYTPPAVATISWWNASTAGTQIGTGSPFETVGTSVLANTNTPGVYTVYAQGEYSGCSGLTRTPVTITVKAISTSTSSATACNSYTWNGTTYTTSGTYTHTLVNSVGCDSIATLNLTINNSSASTTPVTTCVSYTWTNGTVYNTSGTYTQTLTNAAGCDSIATLQLTINQPTSATVNHVACQTYTWPINGMTYVTSGIYTGTIMNAAGCDSVITLNLTIGAPSASLVPVTACSSYTWPQTGLTYNTSGAYNDTILNMYGCDSVITLSLTINQPTSSTVIESECTSFTWPQTGLTYVTSGIYTATIMNAAGCDSVITLNLTILQPTTASVSAASCTSYTWAQNGVTYMTSGAYTDTIPNMAGCDSIITLNLTINQPTVGSVSATACTSYTWAQNGTTYTVSGMYNDTITNAAGCDSVVTLNLTIAPFVATATDNGNATATASAGTTYQWINCTTNSPIAGATAQTFVATVNGTYAAIVSNGTCSDTTNCVTIANVGIKESMISTISVHPNPTHDVVIVTMDASSATVEVMDVQGKLIQTTQIKSGDQIDLSTYERGVYTLRIKTDLGSSIERIVKD